MTGICTTTCTSIGALSLPYAHLNLRFNPFGEVPSKERGQLAVVALEPRTLESMLQRLDKPGYVIQFLGERGRGKTTHLLALREHFPSAPYLHFGEDDPPPKLADIPEAPLLFLDETQRLPASIRKKLFKRTASWVIGTHRDHTRELRRANLDFSVHEFKGADEDYLGKIFDARIRWAIRDPNQAVPRLPREAVTQLIRVFGDDIRAMEGYLYEVVQTMTEVGDVQV